MFLCEEKRFYYDRVIFELYFFAEGEIPGVVIFELCFFAEGEILGVVIFELCFFVERKYSTIVA